jgi:integrase
MFALGFYTGLRISDILRLKWGQITSGPEVVVVEKKTGKARRIQLNPDLQTIIKEARKAAGERGALPAPEEFVFTSKRGPSIGSPLTVVGANIRIRETLEEYGIQTQNASSHCLRKTFARRVYEANGRTEDGLILLSQILNHTGPAMTRKYIGLTREVVAEAYMSL